MSKRDFELKERLDRQLLANLDVVFDQASFPVKQDELRVELRDIPR